MKQVNLWINVISSASVHKLFRLFFESSILRWAVHHLPEITIAHTVKILKGMRIECDALHCIQHDFKQWAMYWITDRRNRLARMNGCFWCFCHYVVRGSFFLLLVCAVDDALHHYCVTRLLNMWLLDQIS